MSLGANETDLSTVFEAINTFLENNNDTYIQYQVINSLTEVLLKSGNEVKFPLHRKLVEIARRVALVLVMTRKLNPKIHRED